MEIDLEKIFEEEVKIVVYDCDGTYRQEYINWLENKAKEAINYTHSSTLLNNSFEIGDTVKYKLEICTIDFIDKKTKKAKLRPNFRNALIINVDLNDCTKIV